MASADTGGLRLADELSLEGSSSDEDHSLENPSPKAAARLAQRSRNKRPRPSDGSDGEDDDGSSGRTSDSAGRGSEGGEARPGEESDGGGGSARDGDGDGAVEMDRTTGDGGDANGESDDDDDIVVPPFPPKTVLRDNPTLAAAFEYLDSALDANNAVQEEIDEARREVEAARRRLDEKLQEGISAASLVREKKRAVLDAESNVDCRWNRMFRLLQEYRRTHGHCRVPGPTTRSKQRDEDDDDDDARGNPDLASSLGQWVAAQRTMYNKMEHPRTKENVIVTKRGQRIHRDLQPHRVRALDRLGFVWNVAEEQWKSNVRDLVAYREEHGDCNVPAKYKDNPRLGTWVHKTRGSYKKFRRGKPTDITVERIRELDGLGFAWTSDFPRTARRETSEYKPRYYARRDDVSEEEEWREQYDRLARFQALHGHCCVSSKKVRNGESKSLGLFVSWQRKQYKLFRSGGASHMTQERVDMLERIGFHWTDADLPLPRGRPSGQRAQVEGEEAEAKK